MDRQHHPSDEIPNEAYPDSAYVPGQGHVQPQSPQPMVYQHDLSHFQMPAASNNSPGLPGQQRGEGYRHPGDRRPLPTGIPLPSSPPPPYDFTNFSSTQTSDTPLSTHPATSLFSDNQSYGPPSPNLQELAFRQDQSQQQREFYLQASTLSSLEQIRNTRSPNVYSSTHLPIQPPPSPLEPAHLHQSPSASIYPVESYAPYQYRPPLEQVEILEPTERLAKIDPHRALRRRRRQRCVCFGLLFLTLVLLVVLGVLVSLKMTHVVDFD